MTRPPVLKHMWIFVKNHRQWLGFGAIAIGLVYAYMKVLYEPRHIVVDIFYGFFFILLIAGLYHAFGNEVKTKHTLKVDVWDLFFTGLGVMVTFSMVHYLELSAVVASSLVGTAGFFIFKRYQVPIYCGSFAGMVSVVLFDFFEVGILALVCGLIFVLTKPLFAGYGGKLGTIAFMSSLITFSIFDKAYLTIEGDFNIWIVLGVCVLGVVLTFYIQHHLKLTAVLASALTTLVVCTPLIYFLSDYAHYAVVFFSASFLGMSSKERLPNFVFVVLSGVILGLIYDIFLAYFHGLGGKLGLMALISVVITTGLSSLLTKPVREWFE